MASLLRTGSDATAPIAEPAITEAPVVELRDVCKKVGGQEVLRGIDPPIYPRRITMIIGASGSGKSMIIGASGSGKSMISKQIVGLCKPDRGRSGCSARTSCR